MTSAPTRPITARGTRPGFGVFLTQVLSDRERFFTEVAEGDGLPAKLAHALWILLALCALYGAAAGAYAGPAQALSAAIKLPLLFLGTLAICFPGFFVIQVLVGSRLRLPQVLALVLGALSLSAIVLAAVVPITAFFLLTGANYYFLTLLHVLIVLGAGLVGMAVLHEGLAFACEKRGVYPKKAMTIMKVWAVLFAFVGIQMAWNLQPFVGDRGQPFQLFRHNEGNFYTAIVYSLQKLSHGEGRGGAAAPPATPLQEEHRLLDFGQVAGPDSGRVPGR
ncbi:MAG: hypothetical protein A2V63_01850 [Candidatus Eisenbacteria bacterium RBG_19FT_COMBO_70_11]|nr:MAG: hypothetical protein A2V63_01850 [Candidatus Eisenbacteria bacterium RBG_19FT_COMBO_70_11]